MKRIQKIQIKIQKKSKKKEEEKNKEMKRPKKSTLTRALQSIPFQNPGGGPLSVTNGGRTKGNPRVLYWIIVFTNDAKISIQLSMTFTRF